MMVREAPRGETVQSNASRRLRYATYPVAAGVVVLIVATAVVVARVTKLPKPHALLRR